MPFQCFHPSSLTTDAADTNSAALEILGNAALQLGKIVGWVDVLFVGDTVATVLVAGIIGSGEALWDNPGNLAFNAQQVLAHFQAHVSHLTPVLSPTVSDDPVLGSSLWVETPTSEGDNVVGALRMLRFRENATSVFDNWLCVNGSSHRSSSQDLSHDFVASSLLVFVVIVNQTILGNGSIWKVINLGALSTHTAKSVAGFARVRSVASRVNLVTESFRTFRRASQVGIASIVGDIANVLDELVSTGVVSTMARSGIFRSTVQNELDAEVDVITLSLASNLDTVSKAGERSMCPARSTVLRNMLVETLGQVTHAIDISPRERVWKFIGHQVGMGKRALEIVMDGIVTDLIAKDEDGDTKEKER